MLSTRASELPAFLLRRVLGPALRRVPLARAAVRGTMNSVYRVALLPFGRNRRRGVARESADWIASADTLNVAAEHYFRAFDEPAFLLDKPFSDSLFFHSHLINLGTLLEGIRLRRACTGSNAMSTAG